jgi:GTPase SAR1 family protein
MYNRPYRFEIYDTSSPTAYTLLAPDVLVLCYDISQRETLYSLKTIWASTIQKFCLSERVPLIVVGLKRDLRKEWEKHEQERGVLGESVMPQEGVRVAGEMRVDRYAECSAVTGELCQEVLEDISKMAAMSTTENGGKSEGPACEVM